MALRIASLAIPLPAVALCALALAAAVPAAGASGPVSGTAPTPLCSPAQDGVSRIEYPAAVSAGGLVRITFVASVAEHPYRDVVGLSRDGRGYRPARLVILGDFDRLRVRLRRTSDLALYVPIDDLMGVPVCHQVLHAHIAVR
jgi:hypothetical protein